MVINGVPFRWQSMACVCNQRVPFPRRDRIYAVPTVMGDYQGMVLRDYVCMVVDDFKRTVVGDYGHTTVGNYKITVMGTL